MDQPEVKPSETLGEPRYQLELTAAQLKITHTALKALHDDFGREEHAIKVLIAEVLQKLPSDHDIRAIDLQRELGLGRRRRMAA